MSDSENRPSLDDPNAWVPYRYIPSNVAAVIFVVAFAATTLMHAFQLVKKRTWYFIPLVIGGIFETLGFVGRIISHNDIWALGPFIMQTLLILVAPALFAASIYIILGRIILLVDGERYSLVRKKWLTKFFVAGDVLSFFMQGAGGGIQSGGTLSSMHTGEKIIIGGLFVQLFFFIFFVIVAGVFHYRLVNDKPLKKQFPPPRKGHKSLSSESSTELVHTVVPRASLNDLPWKRHLYNLYFTSALIVVRSLFRVVEYIQGNSGYLLSHEVFLYVFDALLMLAVMVMFNWIHPSEVTEAYQKRQPETEAAELQQTRDGYMGSDRESHNEPGRNQEVVGGWVPSRHQL